ncbi:TPA: cysteine synthase family protein [Candidatus Poribacteria bacterium]|nr:cysteine synthase family protein [Candidatus Poribacteria bacterium]
MEKNLLTAIGNTPVIEISKLNPNPKVKIYAKLEWFNPSGSLKDRIAKYIIERAEARGELTKDKIILEVTSGNTGIALAMVGAFKGYRVQVVMPEHMSIERRKIMKALGAEIILTPAEGGSDAAIERTMELAKDPKYFLAGQFENEDNVLAHYETTGAEIVQQVPMVSVFIVAMGTGGTAMGVSKRLKEYNPNIKVIGIEPAVCASIQGLKNFNEGYVPPIVDFSLLDERVYVQEAEVFQTAKELAQHEGLFVGMSSGATMYTAIKEAESMDSGTIVILFGDSGNKYLSTAMYS